MEQTHLELTSKALISMQVIADIIVWCISEPLTTIKDIQLFLKMSVILLIDINH